MKLRSALIAGIFAAMMAGTMGCPWLCIASDGGVLSSTFGCGSPPSPP